jgi:hypothetical protein
MFNKPNLCGVCKNCTEPDCARNKSGYFDLALEMFKQCTYEASVQRWQVWLPKKYEKIRFKNLKKEMKYLYDACWIGEQTRPFYFQALNKSTD